MIEAGRLVKLMLVGAALSCSACLIGPNPEFDAGETGTGDEGNTGTSGNECPEGWLDCDDQPGCESELDAPETCGSCKKSCELAGELLECSAGQCSGVVMFTEIADAHVDASSPDTNFGAEPSLLVDDLRSAYIELPGLAAVPNTATIDSAVLHLGCSATGTSLDLYRIEAPWEELDLTAANAPAIDGDVLLSVSPRLGDNAIELAGVLGAWQVGSPKHSIALRPSATPATPIELSSSEGAAPPYLVLDLSW